MEKVKKFAPFCSTAVNFINILRARFSYESYILAAFLVTFWLWRQNFVRKKRAKTLMKLTPGMWTRSKHVDLFRRSRLQRKYSEASFSDVAVM